MSSSWLHEYLLAIEERDQNEKANEALYKTYTRLADRTSGLDARLQQEEPAKAQTTKKKEPALPSSQVDKPPAAPKKPSSSSSLSSASPRTPDNASNNKNINTNKNNSNNTTTLAAIRVDLSEAQRSRDAMLTETQALAEEIHKLQAQTGQDRKRIGELVQERTGLATRMRDRDEELRGKAKLLEHVHDETVSLTLQLNMAEERSRKLERENQELVDRWMARMGQEADAMNNASRFS